MQYGRSLSAQATARTLYIVVGALVFVVLARMLGPGPLGQFAWAVTFLSLAVALADCGMTPVLARDLVATGEDRPVWLANFLALRLLLGLVVGGGAAVAALLFAPPAVLLPLLACCPLLPLIAARFYDPVFQVAGRPWLSLRIALVYVAIAPFATLAAALLDDPVPATVAAHAAASLAYGGAGLVLTLGLLRPRFDAITRRGISDVAARVAPMGASSLITALAMRVDVFILAELGSNDSVGRYNAAFRFLDVGAAVVVTVLTPLLAVLAALAASDTARLREGFRAVMRLVATGGVLGGLLSIGLAGPVLGLVYGPAFVPAGPALSLLAWKLAAAFVSLLAFALVMTLGSIRYAVWNSAVALLVIVTADLLLVPAFGETGAAIGTLLGELTQMTVNLVLARRRLADALEARWFARLGLAGLAGLLVALPSWPGVAEPLPALLGCALFLGLMAAMRALPSNPLPALHIR